VKNVKKMMAVSTENTIRYQLIGLLPHLRRFARGLAKDPYKADDLVQEACERALTKLDRSAEELNLKSFLYRVIYNRWIDNLRRRKTRLTKLIVLSEKNKFKAGDASTDDRLDVMLDLQGALDKLDNEHRAAIMLIGVEGYSYAEAAAVLEVPPGTVASRVARARAKLSELLYQRRGESFRLKAVGKLGEENESEI
jgi:RNA polymerase sigma-70 factor (ECF subfamily)